MRRLNLSKLADHFGDYDLTIRCRKCAHVRVTEPQAVAKIVGWETPIARVAARFRCSNCGGKDVELRADRELRPRGVPKNPH